MYAADALPRIAEQAVAIAGADQAAEQLEVATEVEDVTVGSEHHVRDRIVAAVLRFDAKPIRQCLLVVEDLVDQRRLEAGPARRRADVGMHVAPIDAALGVVDRAEGIETRSAMELLDD